MSNIDVQHFESKTEVALIAVGIVTALGTVGVNISPIVAGLGLTGFAVGFALKDILSNVISGTMILLFQPFQIKDYIAVAGFEGIVINIELRNPVIITPAPASEVEQVTQFNM